MSKEFVVVIRKDSTTGPVVAVSNILTLAAGSGTITSADFFDNSLSGTIVVNNNLGYFSKTAAAITVPTISNVVVSPVTAIESSANVITVTYDITDAQARVVFWKVTGIGSTSESDFVGGAPGGFAYSQVGIRSGVTATIVVNNDAVNESRESYYIDWTLDPYLTAGNYFYRAGPFYIQDQANGIEAYSVVSGASISSYTANSGNLNIVITGIMNTNVTVTGSGLAAGSFPGPSSTYTANLGVTGTLTFANLNPTTAGTFTYTVAFEQGSPATAVKSIAVSI